MVSRKAKIAMEIMDAMHPDGPINYPKETKRGARRAYKLTEPPKKYIAKAAKISRGANIIGVALTVGGGIYKGTKRALDNPEFHKGKAGKSYVDLSVKKPGKYGVDY